jgi:type IV pilus assembly protein PilA
MERKLHNVIRSESGFTLVELMIVVAIVGLLSTIAIPNYQKFVARSRQTEAKLTLSAIYVSEITFFAEQGTFTSCLSDAGFQRVGPRVFYSIGFGNTNTTCGNGSDDCHLRDFSPMAFCAAGAFPAGGYFPANNAATGTPVNRATFNASFTTRIEKTRFTAAAVGRVSSSDPANIDVWTMNESKSISNAVSGI